EPASPEQSREEKMTQKNESGETQALDRRNLLRLGATAAAAAAGVSGLAAPAIGQSPRRLRYGHMVPPGAVYHEAIKRFGDELAALSSNKFRLQIFPSSQLGPISEMLQSVQ